MSAPEPPRSGERWEADAELTGPVRMPSGEPRTAPQRQAWTAGGQGQRSEARGAPQPPAASNAAGQASGQHPAPSNAAGQHPGAPNAASPESGSASPNGAGQAPGPPAAASSAPGQRPAASNTAGQVSGRNPANAGRAPGQHPAPASAAGQGSGRHPAMSNAAGQQSGAPNAGVSGRVSSRNNLAPSAPPNPSRPPAAPGYAAPAGQRPHPAAGRRPAAPPPAAREQRPRQGERKEAVAFVLHQFPIGYLPIAAATPSRQLPAPETPHPRADLVGDADALARAGARTPQDAPGSTPPAGFDAGHDPFAELSELEWEHEYVEPGTTGRPAYRWPAAAPEEPVVLDPDAVLDALGSGEGRLAYPDGTPFAERSLPPAHRELPYRRYRVLRPLPVWRSVAEPWFGARGGAQRYRTTHPLAELVALGLLVELTPDRLAAEAGTVRLDRSEVARADAGAHSTDPEPRDPGRTERLRPDPPGTEESAT